MTRLQEYKLEFIQEMSITRKHLERVPHDKLNFKVAESSEELGRLSVHVAEITAWWKNVLENKALDFENFEPKSFTSVEDLLAYYDDLYSEAIAAFDHANDSVLEDTWSMTHGEEVYFTLPKAQVLRSFCMNHLIHHRAQLGVYLRATGNEVPASYGPSADDFDVLTMQKY